MRDPQRTPTSVRLVKIIGAAQLIALIAAVPVALVYRQRAWHTADGRTPDVDHQYTAYGYLIAAGLAAICAVLVAVGAWRLGSGAGRGRRPLLVGEVLVLVGASSTLGAVSGPTDRHNVYTTLLVLMAVAAVAVLVAANLARARAWSRHTVSGC